MHVETFSYLPPMSEEQVAKQVQHILDHEWYAAIEYTRTPGPANTYWSMWKLPLFDAERPADVLAEVEACRQAHPDCYIKINGYDNRRQGQVLSFVVHRPM